MKKLLIALTFCCGIPFSMNGQDFNDYFVDKTLRVDYILREMPNISIFI